MALKYLNFTGLTDLVTNIMNWVTSRIPTKTSEIDNDSGYLTASDLPTNHVTTNTTQTITSTKTFQNTDINFKQTGITLGTTPSSNQYRRVQSLDNSNTAFAQLVYVQRNDGNTYIELRAGDKFTSGAKATSGTQVWSDFQVGTSSDGNKYIYTDALWSNSLVPYGNNTSSLGNSTHRWTNVYGTVRLDPSAGATADLLYSQMAANDLFRLQVGGTSNNGYVEIATADDGNEPIYVRQYKGVFATLQRTLTLLDGSGNTTLPGTLNAVSYKLNGTAFGDIVTHNASEFLTSHQSLSNYSTLANTVKSLSISGKTITVTPGSGSAYTLTTQDTVYTHPTTSGNKHIPSGGSSGQFLGWDSDGTAKWVNNPNTNTDTLMTQNVSTTNATYPVLLVATADATANQGAKTGIFAKSVKVNPSTNIVSANGFSGAPNTNYVQGVKDGGAVVNSQTTSFGAVWRAPTKNYQVAGATFPSNNDNVYICYSVTNDNVTAGTNTTAKMLIWGADTGTLTANAFSGALTGNVTGNCSGSSGSCTGNASTATQFSANTTVALTGDATGTSAGSKKGWSVPVTLANSGVTAGTYGPSADVTGNNNSTISVPQITVDAKGRVTSVTNRTLTCKNNTYNVYNKTLTIQKNGTNVATFTSNSNTDVTANIVVPTKTSDLTNDSSFVTSNDVSSAINYVVIAEVNPGYFTVTQNRLDNAHVTSAFAISPTLCLPSVGVSTAYDIDTTNWDVSGGDIHVVVQDANSKTVPGYVMIYLSKCAATDFVIIQLTSMARSAGIYVPTIKSGSNYYVKACFPTSGDFYVNIVKTAGTIGYAKLYPFLGNFGFAAPS